MNVALALFVVVGFAVTLEFLNLPTHAREVGQHGKEALEVFRDEERSDREKEEALQQASGRLFGLLGILVGGSTLALGGPLAIVWGLERMGVGSFMGTLAVLERIDFLVGVTVVGGIGYMLVRRLRSG